MHANEPDMAKKWEKEEKNEGNIGITTKKGKSIELTHKKSGKEIVVVNNPSVLKKYAKMGYLISMPEGKLTEKPLKTNPKIWVSDKFDKVIDKLPYSKLTKDNIIKLAKKFKIDKDDALRWVSYNQDVDFGLKEGKLNEAKESAIDVAKRVVQNKQHEKGLDLTTANFIMQVYKAYNKNPSLQKKLEKLPLKKMISIVYKLIK